MTDQVRWDRIRKIRREIAEGSYVTDERLGKTVDAMRRAWSELEGDQSAPLAEKLKRFGVVERCTGRKLSDVEIDLRFGAQVLADAEAPLDSRYLKAMGFTHRFGTTDPDVIHRLAGCSTAQENDDGLDEDAGHIAKEGLGEGRDPSAGAGHGSGEEGSHAS